MTHTENSGERGLPSNSQPTYTTPFRWYLLTAGDIIESNKAIFSAWQKFCRRPLLLWITNNMNTPNIKWSRLISWQRQLIRWLLRIMPINWLQRALMTQKILIIQILEKMMKWMMDGKGSLSMKRIVAFTMKPPWQLTFCLIRRLHLLQWQQQVS